MTKGVSWAEFAASSPELAELGGELFRAAVPAELHRSDSFTGYGFLATIRPDGGPRLAPVTPIMTGGRLYVAVAGRSPKVRDLRRDPRYALHAFLGKDDAEFCVRGQAGETNDPATRAAVIDGGRGWTSIQADDVIYSFEIGEAYTTTWYHVSQPDTRPIRRHWRAAK